LEEGMIARLLAALGFSASGVGLTVYGMATSMSTRNDSMANIGLALLFGGFIAGIIGVAIYRADEKRAMRSHDS